MPSLSPLAWVYAASLLVLCLYGFHRLTHLWALRGAHPWTGPEARTDARVLVQLPLYNERAVAERVIRAAAALDWPAECLHIQVLDDSTDGTRALVDREVRRQQGLGVSIEVLRRTDRGGFKAGALAAGLKVSDQEFIAVFDADFLPRPSFLRETLGAFADPDVGMVQARWHHNNRDESLFTRAQATLLDGHFVIEHQARYASGHCFNFNGTAGVWRRAAIGDGGGWTGDTLTEDLDLSYRAQLAGWRFVYAWGVTAPAELPADAAAFLAQQARWARGSVQVLRKLGGPIARSSFSLSKKMEAFSHLAGNAGQPCLLVLCLTLPFVIHERSAMLGPLHAAAFLLCTVAVLAFYDASQRLVGRPLRKRIVDIFAAMALGIGMCVRQSRAVLLGMLGSTGTFERTPKRGDAADTPYRSRLAGSGWIEASLALLYVGTAARMAWLGSLGSIPFLGLFAWGFGWVALRTIREARVSQNSELVPFAPVAETETVQAAPAAPRADEPVGSK